MVKVLEDDLDHIMRSDDRADAGLQYPRLFDKHWINSDESTFELATVVNRLDRIFNRVIAVKFSLSTAFSTRQIKQTTVRSPSNDVTWSSVKTCRRGLCNHSEALVPTRQRARCERYTFPTSGR